MDQVAKSTSDASNQMQSCKNPKHLKEAKPKSEKLCPGIDQIPFVALEELGLIFDEGATKYGVGNWMQAPTDVDYDRERTRHAIRHLYLYANGDRSEPHLAKVMWFCVTSIWRNKRKEKQ